MNTLRSSAIPVSDPSAGLRITEIFYSLQGEANAAGLPTVFIRLTGCPLRCSYCDTTYSFEGGERQSLDDIIQTTLDFKTPYVCVTGGEPLARDLAQWILEDHLPVRFQLQLHKLLWNDETGR